MDHFTPVPDVPITDMQEAWATEPFRPYTIRLEPWGPIVGVIFSPQAVLAMPLTGPVIDEIREQES